MSDFKVYKLKQEIDNRLKNPRFGESNKKCIVVRLDTLDEKKFSFNETVFFQKARGYKASFEGTKNCSFIVLTDSMNFSILASIVEVNRNKEKKERIDIFFRDPCHINKEEIDKYVDWNNSNPVRKIEF